MKKILFGGCALGAWVVAMSMAACSVGPVEPADEETVGEAAQEVGVGATCTLWLFCDAGLTCCNGSQPSSNGTCRNLKHDEYNCGACGHVCGRLEHCSAGHCCPSGMGWNGSQCVELCLPNGAPCSVDIDCCSESCDLDGFCVP